MRIQALLVLISMSPGAAPAVEFDCIQIPANPVSRPPDCDNPDHPFYDPAWCACLKTGLTSLRGGEPAAFEQAIIEVYHQPTIGKQVLSVSGGTLDLSVVRYSNVGAAFEMLATAGVALGGDRIDQLFTDPTNPVQRTFEDVFQIQAGPKEAFRRGDTNGDGTIDLSDAVFELNFLFLGGETPACPDAGDLNDDGLLDISDPVSSLNFQFLGGEPPPSPGPGACGPDPTGDALGVCIQRC